MIRVLLACLLLIGTMAPASAEYADVVINRQSEANGMRPVVFSHWFHRIRFRCKVCHSELGFVMRVGANHMSMAEIIDAIGEGIDVTLCAGRTDCQDGERCLTHELWQQLNQSGGLAMHISGEFPGLELEFWAVRG